MTGDKNEIDNLIDTMIESGDELVNNLKTVLPNSLSESMIMFHESNVENLKKVSTSICSVFIFLISIFESISGRFQGRMQKMEKSKKKNRFWSYCLCSSLWLETFMVNIKYFIFNLF